MTVEFIIRIGSADVLASSQEELRGGCKREML